MSAHWLVVGKTKKQLGPLFLRREALAGSVGSPGRENAIRLMYHTYLHCLSVAHGGSIEESFSTLILFHSPCNSLVSNVTLCSLRVSTGFHAVILLCSS